MTKSITESINALVDAMPQRPDEAVIDRLRADLSVVSSDLLSGAIQEIAATAKKQLPEAPAEGDIRGAIYRIYNRKVAEHAQMFPMFHTVETALRASLAVELETHYGIQAWWTPVLKGVMSSGWDPKSVTRIGNINVHREIPYRMGRTLQSLIDKKVAVAGFRTGNELLTTCDFSHLVYLIEDHWSLFAARFVFKGQIVSKQLAVTFLDRIRDARNAVYHHQSFEGAPAAYDAADLVMQCLGVKLAKVHPLIAGAQCKPPPYFSKLAAVQETQSDAK